MKNQCCGGMYVMKRWIKVFLLFIPVLFATSCAKIKCNDFGITTDGSTYYSWSTFWTDTLLPAIGVGFGLLMIVSISVFLLRYYLKKAGRKITLPAITKRNVTIIAIIVFIVASLFPPWMYTARGIALKPIGYASIFFPPQVEDMSMCPKIDFSRLFIEYLVIGVTFSGFYLLLMKKSSENHPDTLINVKGGEDTKNL